MPSPPRLASAKASTNRITSVLRSGWRSLTQSSPRRALARQLTRLTGSPGLQRRRSANSIPSPTVRDTSSPVESCVARGEMMRRSASSRGKTRNSGRTSAIVSQARKPSGSKARTYTGPSTCPPQWAARRRQVELATLAGHEAERDRVAALGDLDRAGEPEVDVEPVDRGPGPKDQSRSDLFDPRVCAIRRARPRR